MKIIHKISVLFLLLIITFSSVGISFYLHACDCKETTMLSLATGYNGPGKFCCCSSQLCHPVEGNFCHTVDEKGCCSEFYYFYLLPFCPDKAISGEPVFSAKSFFLPVHSSIPEETKISDLNEVIQMPQSPPVLLTGKQLVFFIQQIKIPFPTC